MLKEWVKLTDDPVEIRDIALRLMKEITIISPSGEKKKLYTPLMLDKMKESIRHYAPEASEEECSEMCLKFIYDYWVFGCTVDEEFYLHLKDKNDTEKREYMVSKMRSVYVRHLNWDAGDERVILLEDKYRLY